VIEHVARTRVQLPTSCPEVALFRSVALNLMPRPMSRGAVCPYEPPTWPINPERPACRVASRRSRRTECRHASARLTCKKVPRDA
jgi:hypothetical protein